MVNIAELPYGWGGPQQAQVSQGFQPSGDFMADVKRINQLHEESVREWAKQNGAWQPANVLDIPANDYGLPSQIGFNIMGGGVSDSMSQKDLTKLLERGTTAAPYSADQAASDIESLFSVYGIDKSTMKQGDSFLNLGVGNRIYNTGDKEDINEGALPELIQIYSPGGGYDRVQGLGQYNVGADIKDDPFGSPFAKMVTTLLSIVPNPLQPYAIAIQQGLRAADGQTLKTGDYVSAALPIIQAHWDDIVNLQVGTNPNGSPVTLGDKANEFVDGGKTLEDAQNWAIQTYGDGVTVRQTATDAVTNKLGFNVTNSPSYEVLNAAGDVIEGFNFGTADTLLGKLAGAVPDWAVDAIASFGDFYNKGSEVAQIFGSETGPSVGGIFGSVVNDQEDDSNDFPPLPTIDLETDENVFDFPDLPDFGTDDNGTPVFLPPATETPRVDQSVTGTGGGSKKTYDDDYRYYPPVPDFRQQPERTVNTIINGQPVSDDDKNDSPGLPPTQTPAGGEDMAGFLDDILGGIKDTLGNIISTSLSDIGNTAINFAANDYAADKFSDATDKELALQRDMFNQNIQRMQPFYNMGVSNIPALQQAASGKPSYLDPMSGQRTLNPNANFNLSGNYGPVSEGNRYVNAPTAGAMPAVGNVQGGALPEARTVGVNRVDVLDVNNPFYQAARQQGEESVKSLAAARGKLNSGNTLKELNDVGMATYLNFVPTLQNVSSARDSAALASDAQRYGQGLTNQQTGFSQGLASDAQRYGQGANNQATQYAQGLTSNQFLNQLNQQDLANSLAKNQNLFQQDMTGTAFKQNQANQNFMNTMAANEQMYGQRQGVNDYQRALAMDEFNQLQSLVGSGQNAGVYQGAYGANTAAAQGDILGNQGGMDFYNAMNKGTMGTDFLSRLLFGGP